MPTNLNVNGQLLYKIHNCRWLGIPIKQQEFNMSTVYPQHHRSAFYA